MGFGIGRMGAGFGRMGALGTKGAFRGSDLFAGGAKGFWYDPSDLSTLFQDSTGTTPVTADGDPVGKILDKSGNGLHATQATDGKRPLFKISGGIAWLEFDGSNDCLATASVNLTGTDKITIYGAVQVNNSSTAVIMELSDGFAVNAGAFLWDTRNAANGDFAWGLGTTGVLATATFRQSDPHSIPYTVVSSCVFDISAAGVSTEILPRLNGATPSLSSTGTSNSGSFGTYAVNLGARANGGSLPLLGRFYGGAMVGKKNTGAEIAAMERFLASRGSVQLS